MVEEFKKAQPELFYKRPRIVDGKEQAVETRIPYDWTIYYLRKKALIEKVTKEELAWILLNFNQKRGYFQARGEDDEATTDKKEYVEVLRVINIKKGEPDKKNNNRTWYTLMLHNGWIYSATFTAEP